MKESIPHLEIELLPNGNLRLENESMGDSYVVDVHPMHLRLMAERLGLVREMSQTDAQLLKQERERADKLRAELDRLVQWLTIVEARADQLHDNLMGVSQNDHDEVNIEIAQSAALADIVEQVLIDAKAALARSLVNGDVQPTSGGDAQEPLKTPDSGGVKAPQKRGASKSPSSSTENGAAPKLGAVPSSPEGGPESSFKQPALL
ncbi:MAG: hypothetical protein ACK4NM_07660 [Hydrogenophaga sp.]